MMHLITYKHGAYTSFFHLPSALVCKVNLFSTDIKFVQLYFMLFISIIVDSVKHVGGRCWFCKSDFKFNTTVKMRQLNFLAQKWVANLELDAANTFWFSQFYQNIHSRISSLCTESQQKYTRATCQIYLKLTKETPEWCLVLLLLTLNIYCTLFYC